MEIRFLFDISDREQSSPLPLSLSLSFQQQSLSGETMDPTLVPGTRFESQFQICVYEHAILRIYISFFNPTIGIGARSDNELWLFICMNFNNLC